jgi:transcription elongation factor Elf1
MKNITFKQLKKLVTENIDDDELSPCEWCGSDNVSVIEYPTVKIDGKVKAVAYYAQCHSCGKKGETMFKRDEAIEIWNYTMDAIKNGTYEENSDFGVID